MAQKDIRASTRMILLDTDVLIQYFRGDVATRTWIRSLGDVALPIPGAVAMELIAGSRNKVEHQRSQELIAGLKVVWHSEADNQLGFELLSRYRLSTGMSPFDFLIAAQALNRGATLYTFNLKHFSATLA